MQVRAAMPGMPVSEQNCHPFQWSRYMWMHNGMVRSFRSSMPTLKATSTPMHDMEGLWPDAGGRDLLETAMKRRNYLQNLRLHEGEACAAGNIGLTSHFQK